MSKQKIIQALTRTQLNLFSNLWLHHGQLQDTQTHCRGLSFHMNSRSPFRGHTNILISDPGSTVLVWQFSDLAATVTLHSESIRLCIWTLHAACRLSSDPANHWTVCVRGEKEGGDRARSTEEREAEMKMKITRGECAGDGTEGRVRRGGVTH